MNSVQTEKNEGKSMTKKVGEWEDVPTVSKTGEWEDVPSTEAPPSAVQNNTTSAPSTAIVESSNPWKPSAERVIDKVGGVVNTPLLNATKPDDVNKNAWDRMVNAYSLLPPAVQYGVPASAALALGGAALKYYNSRSSGGNLPDENTPPNNNGGGFKGLKARFFGPSTEAPKIEPTMDNWFSTLSPDEQEMITKSQKAAADKAAVSAGQNVSPLESVVTPTFEETRIAKQAAAAQAAQQSMATPQTTPEPILTNEPAPKLSETVPELDPKIPALLQPAPTAVAPAVAPATPPQGAAPQPVAPVANVAPEPVPTVPVEPVATPAAEPITPAEPVATTTETPTATDAERVQAIQATEEPKAKVVTATEAPPPLTKKEQTKLDKSLLAGKNQYENQLGAKSFPEQFKKSWDVLTEHVFSEGPPKGQGGSPQYWEKAQAFMKANPDKFPSETLKHIKQLAEKYGKPTDQSGFARLGSMAGLGSTALAGLLVAPSIMAAKKSAQEGDIGMAASHASNVLNLHPLGMLGNMLFGTSPEELQTLRENDKARKAKAGNAATLRK